MLADNAYYGHAAALARYCGIEGRVPPIWGHLQHGVTLGYPFEGYRTARHFPRLVWGDAAAELSRARGDTNVRVVGAPMLYLNRSVSSQSEGRATTSNPTTLVYPFHSWEGSEIMASHGAFAREIRDREPGDVTVCLYWREALDPAIIEAYADQGFRVVCNGHRMSADFLPQQLAEFKRHQRFVTNRLGSGAFYASHLGLSVEQYGPRFGIGSADEALIAAELYATRWPEFFSRSTDQEAIRATANRELGAGQLLEPNELQHLLGWRSVRRSAAPLVRSVVAIRGRIKRRRREPVPKAPTGEIVKGWNNRA